MSELTIVITAPLPESPVEAFRTRHKIEGEVVAFLSELDGMEGLSVSVSYPEVGKSAERPAPRKRGPNKRTTGAGAANGSELFAGTPAA